MDFLDSLDLHNTDKKSNRVRSWYLYEQYKSLEKNQLDAAKKLKNRSYQNRILHRELGERRARRHFRDQSNLTQSECHIERSVRRDPSGTPFSESTDSFFESVCDQEDVVSGKGPEDDHLSKLSETSNVYDIKSFDNKEDCPGGYSTSVNSIVEKSDITENDADVLKEELESVKKNIAEIIHLQIETQKEIVERYSELCDSESSNSIENYNSTKIDKYAPKYDNGFLTIWAKLVSFSYNIMQTNRGNCYYDYSTQLLTAVLAFDVFRRGINRMCHILQPFVSPIKFAGNESDETLFIDDNFKENHSHSKKSNENYAHTKYRIRKSNFNENYRSLERKYRSEDGPCCKYSFENRLNEMKYHGASEPWRSVAKLSGGKNSFGEILSYTKFSQMSETDQCSESCKCRHLTKAINPMVKLSRYIDMILQEVDD